MSIEVAKRLAVGDVFYECEYGVQATIKVTEKPYRTDEGQWKWKGEIIETTDNNIMMLGECDYLITEGYEHYGPRISLTQRM